MQAFTQEQPQFRDRSFISEGRCQGFPVTLTILLSGRSSNQKEDHSWGVLNLLSLQLSFISYWPGFCEWDWTLKRYSDLMENHILKLCAASELDLPLVSMTCKL